jgi:hypothetical protein
MKRPFFEGIMLHKEQDMQNYNLDIKSGHLLLRKNTCSVLRKIFELMRESKRRMDRTATKLKREEPSRASRISVGAIFTDPLILHTPASGSHQILSVTTQLPHT